MVTLSLTAGNNPVDLSKMVVSYAAGTNYMDNIFSGKVSTGYTLASDIIMQLDRLTAVISLS